MFVPCADVTPVLLLLISPIPSLFVSAPMMFVYVIAVAQTEVMAHLVRRALR